MCSDLQVEEALTQCLASSIVTQQAAVTVTVRRESLSKHTTNMDPGQLFQIITNSTLLGERGRFSVVSINSLKVEICSLTDAVLPRSTKFDSG